MPTPGGTTARGYGTAHLRLRAAWQPTVQAGNAHCHATTCHHPTRWIPPHTPWDLGHTPDRTGWTGPEHRDCNRIDGAQRGNQQRANRNTTHWTTSRTW